MIDSIPYSRAAEKRLFVNFILTQAYEAYMKYLWHAGKGRTSSVKKN